MIFEKIPAMLKFSKYQSGFTIVEALVAVSVLAIAFVAVVQIFPGVIGLNADTKRLSTATHLASQKLEEMAATPYANIPINEDPDYTNFTEQGFTGYAWKAKVTQEDDDLKRIEMTVAWDDYLRSVTLTTFKAR